MHAESNVEPLIIVGLVSAAHYCDCALPPDGLERWRPSRNISSPIRTAPIPMRTQPQAGKPLLLDCSEPVPDAGNTWTVAVRLVIDVLPGD